jgi:hypothetical protein
MKHVPKGSLVSYEPIVKGETQSFVYQIDAMLASQSLGLKCINGYSAVSPKDYHFYWLNMDEPSRNIWLTSKSINPDSLYVIH